MVIFIVGGVLRVLLRFFKECMGYSRSAHANSKLPRAQQEESRETQFYTASAIASAGRRRTLGLTRRDCTGANSPTSTYTTARSG